ARAAGHASHQHDAHRVAAVAPAQVGIRVFHRRGRPYEGCAAGAGTGGAACTQLPLSGARLVPEGRAVSAGAMATEAVRALAPYVIGKPIQELARELGIDEADIIKLASNEN